MSLTTEDLGKIKELFTSERESTKSLFVAEREHTKRLVDTSIKTAIDASEQRLIRHMDGRFKQASLETAEVITRLGDYMEARFDAVDVELKEIKRDAKALERVVARHSHDIMKLRAA